MAARYAVSTLTLLGLPVSRTAAMGGVSASLLPSPRIIPVMQCCNPSGEGEMAVLYSTRVTATGGRHGSIRSDDGLLELQLALPRTLGGKGGATNPEQLFAGGY